MQLITDKILVLIIMIHVRKLMSMIDQLIYLRLISRSALESRIYRVVAILERVQIIIDKLLMSILRLEIPSLIFVSLLLLMLTVMIWFTTDCLTKNSLLIFFFFSSRRRHTRLVSDWSSDVCSSD